MSELILDQDGQKLAETCEGVTLPTDTTFDKVNGWIHGLDVSFEEVQALCLGMAVELDKIKSMDAESE